MKFKKIIYVLSISFLLLNTSFAEDSSNKIIGDNKPLSPIKIKSNYSSEDINTLNMYLEKQDYVGFYDYFQKTNVAGVSQIKYLEEKKYDGHVPLYWLMAEYYAKSHHDSETHKWLYIATIMTQQDAALCSDTTSRFASQKLLKTFSSAADLVRTTPQYINNAMAETIFFIENLKTRTGPQWACNFGEQQLNPNASILIPKQNWAGVRKKIFDNYTSKFRK